MQTCNFQLRGQYVELNLLLKLVGLCDSGGAGKRLVADGNVQVDGQPELRKTCKIHGGQQVDCGDTRIQVLADLQASVPARHTTTTSA